MELNEYQERAEETAIYNPDLEILYPTLGLSGEAGEVADKVKKVMRDKDGFFDDATRLDIAKEIGDVLWYCAVLARDLDFTLEQIAAMNIEKLASRKARGVLSGSGDNR